MIEILGTNFNNIDFQSYKIQYNGTWDEFKNDVKNNNYCSKVIQSTLPLNERWLGLNGEIKNIKQDDEFHLLFDLYVGNTFWSTVGFFLEGGQCCNYNMF